MDFTQVLPAFTSSDTGPQDRGIIAELDGRSWVQICALTIQQSIKFHF